MTEEHRKTGVAELSGDTRQQRRVTSAQLFGQDNRLEIEHKGEIYTLRITRHDKLILTK